MQTAQQKKNHRQQEPSEAQRQLLQEYFDTVTQLRQVRRAFERVTEPELISACVYEMNALQQRYSYLLQRVREERLTYLRILR